MVILFIAKNKLYNLKATNDGKLSEGNATYEYWEYSTGKSITNSRCSPVFEGWRKEKINKGLTIHSISYHISNAVNVQPSFCYTVVLLTALPPRPSPVVECSLPLCHLWSKWYV